MKYSNYKMRHLTSLDFWRYECEMSRVVSLDTVNGAATDVSVLHGYERLFDISQ